MGRRLFFFSFYRMAGGFFFLIVNERQAAFFASATVNSAHRNCPALSRAAVSIPERMVPLTPADDLHESELVTEEKRKSGILQSEP